ncbi:Ubiquitin carboxyl-terminal hydrolase 16 [Mortierella claussenii]|nr:Ubiquitin carboxyl-terminal hydrolase 16 [Mortierella claussenii]
MAGKKKKQGKAKSKGAKGQVGRRSSQTDEAVDAAILKEVIASSAKSAELAAVEESFLSEAIQASLQLSSSPAAQPQDNVDPVSKDNIDVEDTLLLSAISEAQHGVEKCQHIKDAVKPPALRKVINKIEDWDHCQGCLGYVARIKSLMQGLNSSTATPELTTIAEGMTESLPADALWMCLTCGEISCGRTLSQHAVAHHKDQSHPLAINLDSLDCWCYECDDQLATSKGKNPIAQESQTILNKALQARQAKMRAQSVAQVTKSKGPAAASITTKAKIYTPGLQNLGNTCFFNSVMQVLGETRSLKTILSDKDPSGFPVSLSAKTEGGLGPLTTTFKGVLFAMWKQQGGIVTPKELFTQIAKKWRVFRGFKEQDSQELMRHLFDGIRLEEVDLIKKKTAEELGTITPISSTVVVNGKDNRDTSPKYVPFIDSCFSGKLVSVIVCQACKKCSYSFENYFDLSLPVKGPPPTTGGSLVDILRARSRAAGFDLSTDAGDDKYPISKADQGSEGHLKHVEKLLKNVPPQSKVGPDALSIERSLSQFTSVDCLEGQDKFACENCYKLVKSYGVSAVENESCFSVKATDSSIKGQAEMESAIDETIVLPAGDEEEVSSKESVSEPDIDQGPSDATDAMESKSPNSKSNAEVKEQTLEPKHILRTAYKRYLVSTLPPTLVLHLKRFEQSASRLGLMRKIEDHVEIPVELDMSPYCIPKSELMDEDVESLYQEDMINALAGIENPEGEKVSKKYRLYGATVHQGSLATGHYSNYVLSSKVELPPPASMDGKASIAKSAILAPNGADLPDIPLSELLAQHSQQKSSKKKKAGQTNINKMTPAATPAPLTDKPTEIEVAMLPGDQRTHANEAETDTRQWIHCSDTTVRLASLQEVLASRPYLLYYERC